MLRTTVLVLMALLTGLMVVVIEPILPALLTHFADTPHAPTLVRLVATTSSIGVAFGMPLAGLWIDRATPKPVLLCGLLLFSAAGLAPLLLDSLWAILLSRLLVGMALGAVLTAMLSIIGAQYDGEGRARVLAIQAIVGAVGLFGFAVLSGQLGQFGWRQPFVLYGIPMALALLAAFAIRDGRTAPASAEPGSDGAMEDPRPVIAMLCALLFLSNVASFAYITQMPFILKDLGQGDPRTIGFVLGVPAGLSALTGALLLPVLARRAKSRHVFGTILAGLAGCLAICATIPSPNSLMVAGFFATLAPTLLAPWSNLVVMMTAPQARRGIALAAVGSAASVGQFVSPILVQPAAERFGMPSVLLALAAICALTSVVLVAVRARLPGASPPARAPAVGGHP